MEIGIVIGIIVIIVIVAVASRGAKDAKGKAKRILAEGKITNRQEFEYVCSMLQRDASDWTSTGKLEAKDLWERLQALDREQKDLEVATQGKTSEDAASPISIDGPGSFPVRVVGEQHYQDNLSKIWGSSTKDEDECITSAILIHDDKNPYDNKAIRVEIDGKHVGHLGKAEARSYRKRMASNGHAGKTASCRAKITEPSNRMLVDDKGKTYDWLLVFLDLPQEFVEQS